MLRLKLPASSANIGPGFDCLGLAVKIYNYYTFFMKEEDNRKTVPGSECKLTSLAMEEAFKYMGKKKDNVRVKLESNIPVARGLGSSAADIIAGVAGASILLENKLTEEEILKLAIKIESHPDNVVAAYRGGLNINVMTENGPVSKKLRINNSDLKIIFVIPDFRLATEQLRRVLPEKVNFTDAVYNHSRTALLTACFYDGDWLQLGEAMKDKLHQDYRAELIPGFHQTIEVAYESGALGVALSGAGPTLLAFAKNNCDQIGQKMVNSFQRRNIKSSYLITRPDNKGMQIL